MIVLQDSPNLSFVLVLLNKIYHSHSKSHSISSSSSSSSNLKPNHSLAGVNSSLKCMAADGVELQLHSNNSHINNNSSSNSLKDGEMLPTLAAGLNSKSSSSLQRPSPIRLP